MSRSADDEDHTYFMKLEGRQNVDGDPLVLSRAAFQLHGFGIMNSISDGHPGFVSDDYLNAISAETSVTATELCVIGMWRRVDGGYEVVDREMLDWAIEANQRWDEVAQLCRAAETHLEDPDNPGRCRNCSLRMDL